MKWGPTSANCSPARIVFVRTPEGKEKLRPSLSSGNLAKTLAAPVTAIIAWDSEFYERLPELFPHGDARSWFTSSPALAERDRLSQQRHAGGVSDFCLSGAGAGYRPNVRLRSAKSGRGSFFMGTTLKSNLLINIGYGDVNKVYGRLPRLSLKDACGLV